MNTEDMHLIYPLSLVMGMSILMESFFPPETPIQGFILGVLFTYVSWVIVYFTFLRKKIQMKGGKK